MEDRGFFFAIATLDPEKSISSHLSLPRIQEWKNRPFLSSQFFPITGHGKGKKITLFSPLPFLPSFSAGWDCQWYIDIFRKRGRKKRKKNRYWSLSRIFSHLLAHLGNCRRLAVPKKGVEDVVLVAVFWESSPPSSAPLSCGSDTGWSVGRSFWGCFFPHLLNWFSNFRLKHFNFPSPLFLSGKKLFFWVETSSCVLLQRE